MRKAPRFVLARIEYPLHVATPGQTGGNQARSGWREGGRKPSRPSFNPGPTPLRSASRRSQPRRGSLLGLVALGLLLTGVAAEAFELPPAAETASVVYLPERHDSDADHRFQLRALRELAGSERPLAVGMEMFDVTQQPDLDAWFRREIPTRELFRRTGFDQGWARYSGWYRRILDWCRDHRIAVIALNAPRRVTRAVAQGATVPEPDRRFLPVGIRRPPGGFEAFAKIFPAHGAHGGDLGNFYEAQLTWDMTMARRVAGFLEENPDWRLAVLAGNGHVETGYGIPWFVARLDPAPQLILRRAE